MAHETLRTRNTKQDTETTSTQTCPECDGRLRTTDAETTCEDCGLVATDQHIDHGPEWRAYNDEAEKRTGAPQDPSLHDGGLSTTLYTGADGNGNPLPARKQAQMQRLRKRHSRSRYENKIERNKMHVFSEIRRITSALGIADIVQNRACDLYKSAQKEDLIQGRTLEGFAAACVYATCRCLGLPWERAEFKTVGRCPPNCVDVAYDVMNQELGLPTRPLSAKAFVPRYAAELDLSDAVRQDAEALAEQADESRAMNGEGSVIAGAALYLAALGTQHRLTQEDAAAVADCTSVALRSRYHDLRDLQNQ